MISLQLLAFLCVTAAVPAQAERSVVQALTDTNLSFDPVYASDASLAVIMDSLFDTLVSWDAEGHLVPAQASRWEISDDKLVYTFHIGPENHWTDGAPVVADDFVAAFRRFADPATDDMIVLRYLLDPVVNAVEIGKGEKTPESLGVRAVDDQTFEIRLSAPAGYFLEVLAWPGLAAVPAHLVAEKGADWDNPEHLVSNGPYKIKLNEPGHLVLERNEAFHIRHEPDRLEFVFAKTEADMMRLVASDKVDIVLNLQQKEVMALQSGGWVKTVATATSPSTTYLCFNTTRPPLNDPRVRQAINLAIDREVLNAAQIEYDGVVATTFTSPSLFVYEDPALPPTAPSYADRLTQSRALLAEAGYDEAHPLSLKLIRRTASPQSQPVFVGVRSMLSQLPIRLETAELERKDLLKHLTRRDFDTAILTWLADYSDPMTFLSLFRAGGFANFSGWESEPYQAALQQALGTPDRKAREKLYLQMEGMIRDNVPIIPLRHSSISVVSTKSLQVPKLINGILFPRLVHFVD